jgi:hypothetical protein
MLRAALFVASAAVVAGAIHYGFAHPFWLLCALALLSLVPLQRALARRRLTRLLETGDVTRLLASWESLPNPSPRGRAAERLMRATALASYGWTVRARQLLDIHQDNNSNSAGLEHRVFLEVLLSALEGNHERSLAMALALDALPLPEDRYVRQRSIVHRQGAMALARAFAKCGRPGDREALRRTARQNPLLIWPMRYAEAQLSLQQGDSKRAKRLLRLAPAWPPQSVFRHLTQSLQSRLNGA